ncbi:MAG: hypothetical protein M0R06_00415 [Sphaerochaeta sp.]|jgi:hypothetical protein|nr:hypothetical protein [Sphaerochaeta sp.]
MKDKLNLKRPILEKVEGLMTDFERHSLVPSGLLRHHAYAHESGGADELNLEGLSGESAEIKELKEKYEQLAYLTAALVYLLVDYEILDRDEIVAVQEERISLAEELDIEESGEL